MPDLIESKANGFGGVVVGPESLTDNPVEFSKQLAHSLSFWNSEGYKVVWLEIPIGKAALIPVAVEAGFSFHHSGHHSGGDPQPGGDYLLLTCQLVNGAHIPPYASHYIGAGGVVLNDQKELLVVREKYGFGGRPPTLKLPGGALRSGEHLADAVVREVLEETGVQTCFEAVVCFRHWHGYRYRKSDIYFVCRLRSLSTEISMQEEEIQECLWMPVDEFLESDSISPFNQWIVRAGLEHSGMVLTSVTGFPGDEEREFFVAVDRAQID